MEVKKIVEGMTAVEVAEVIDSNFKNQNKILEEDIAKQNNVIGVSEYKDFSEAETVNVGDVRKYEGFLYECVEATTGAFDANKWKKSSFKAETEKKLSELGSKLIKLKGFYPTDVDISDLEIGDIVYNTSSTSEYYRKLRKFEGNDGSTAIFSSVPYLDGAIYTYNDELYVYNGLELKAIFDIQYLLPLICGSINADIEFSESKVKINSLYIQPNRGGAAVPYNGAIGEYDMATSSGIGFLVLDLITSECKLYESNAYIPDSEKNVILLYYSKGVYKSGLLLYYYLNKEQEDTSNELKNLVHSTKGLKKCVFGNYTDEGVIEVFSFPNVGYISSDGAVVEDYSYGYTDVIYIRKGYYLIMEGVGKGMPYYAICNQEGVISSVGELSDGPSSNTFVKIFKNECYVRLNGRVKEWSNESSKKSYAIIVAHYVAKEIEDINIRLNSIDVSVEDLNLSDVLEWQTGAQIIAGEGNPTYGVGTVMPLTSGKRDASDFYEIDSSLYPKIYTTLINAPGSSIGGMVFYDENKEAIEGHFLNGALVEGYIEKTIPVPMNARYFRTTRWNEIVGITDSFKCILLGNKSHEEELNEVKERLELLESNNNNSSLNASFPLIGCSEFFVSESIDGGDVNDKNTSDFYSMYDGLVAEHPNFFIANGSIGRDASNTYEIKRYTMSMNSPFVSSSYEPGTGDNSWDAETMGNRTIVITSGVHGNEKSSIYGIYLAVKNILESEEGFAKFIKSNFTIEIIPIVNPWAVDRNLRVNANNVNLNRVFVEGSQSEAAAVQTFLKSVSNLHAVIDSHNSTYVNGDEPTGGSVNLAYVCSKQSFKRHHYYCNVSAKLAAGLYHRMKDLWGDTNKSPYITTWLSSNSSTLMAYVNDVLGVIGVTMESPNSDADNYSLTNGYNSVKWAEPTMAMAINLIQIFGVSE